MLAQQWASRKLNEAGYNIVEIILDGGISPKNSTTMPSTTSAPVASAFPTQIVAAAVAVLTAFVLWRITSGSSELLTIDACLTSAYPQPIFAEQAKKETPVLNPHEYQDFPLVEKIVVSHNTAM